MSDYFRADSSQSLAAGVESPGLDERNTSRTNRLEVTRKPMKMHRNLLALSVAFLMLGAVALAHHSAAHYSKQATTTRGTVIEYRWRNPHVYVVWEVKNKNGAATQWVGELSSVTSMIA